MEAEREEYFQQLWEQKCQWEERERLEEEKEKERKREREKEMERWEEQDIFERENQLMKEYYDHQYKQGCVGKKDCYDM